MLKKKKKSLKEKQIKKFAVLNVGIDLSSCNAVKLVHLLQARISAGSESCG